MQYKPLRGTYKTRVKRLLHGPLQAVYTNMPCLGTFTQFMQFSATNLMGMVIPAKDKITKHHTRKKVRQAVLHD